MLQNNKEKSNSKQVESEEAHPILRGANRRLRKEARRWPALLALLGIGGAYAILSDRLTVGPGWLLPVFLAILASAAIISRLKGNHHLNHIFLVVVCVLVTLAEVASIGLLLVSLPDKTITAVSLLRDAALLWGSNIVIFSLWYWQIDGGGPYARSHESYQDYRQQAELLFPVLTLVEQQAKYKEWRPGFMDYLFVAFNTSTAFSPTDTPVLSTRFKALSMVQAIISLVTLATLGARAINIL